MRLRIALLLVAALVLGGVELSLAAFSDQKANPGNTFTAASSFCSSPGTQTVKTNKDSYWDQDAPSTNFGNSSDLFVLSKSGNKNRRTGVSFSLPSKPAGCSVTAAKLRLWQTAGVNGRTIQAYRASAAWTETGVNWNNRPGTTGTPATLASSNGTGWREWQGANMVTLVEALYTGPNNGFVLRDATEDAGSSPEQKYQSRQGSPDSQDPELVVTFG